MSAQSMPEGMIPISLNFVRLSIRDFSQSSEKQILRTLRFCKIKMLIAYPAHRLHAQVKDVIQNLSCLRGGVLDVAILGSREWHRGDQSTANPDVADELLLPAGLGTHRVLAPVD